MGFIERVDIKLREKRRSIRRNNYIEKLLHTFSSLKKKTPYEKQSLV